MNYNWGGGGLLHKTHKTTNTRIKRHLHAYTDTNTHTRKMLVGKTDWKFGFFFLVATTELNLGSVSHHCTMSTLLQQIHHAYTKLRNLLLIDFHRNSCKLKGATD